jgi:DNA polymerase III subunit gamma/tau
MLTCSRALAASAKTSTARIFAKALNCVTGPTDTPCNECDICKSITAGDDVDVIEIDGASNRGIDDIRQLRQNVNVRPSRARFKIYIIDEVHMLSRDAFNALLKTLEEPPEHVKFIFCTTEPEKIPITILSRCQRFDFAGIETATIAERLRQITLAEGVEMQGEAIELLARRAAGSMRDGQSLLEQILAAGGKTVTVDDVQRLLGIAADTRLIALVDALSSRNAAAALAQLGQGVDQGVDVGQLLDQLIGYLRDLLVAAVGCPSTSFLYVAPSRAAQVAQVGPANRRAYALSDAGDCGAGRLATQANDARSYGRRNSLGAHLQPRRLGRSGDAGRHDRQRTVARRRSAATGRNARHAVDFRFRARRRCVNAGRIAASHGRARERAARRFTGRGNGRGVKKKTARRPE